MTELQQLCRANDGRNVENTNATATEASALMKVVANNKEKFPHDAGLVIGAAKALTELSILKKKKEENGLVIKPNSPSLMTATTTTTTDATPPLSSAAGAGTGPSTSFGDADLLRRIVPRCNKNPSSSTSSKDATSSSGGTTRRHPWKFVEMSAETEKAMEDFRDDWSGWVAPFTEAGMECRKRMRAEKEGGGGTGKAEEELPKKKKTAVTVDYLARPQTFFCHRSEPSIILPSTPPQQLLNAVLACRGYSRRKRPTLFTARSRRAASRPSALRAASHGPAVLRAVDSSDASALASLLHSGLHPNGCDGSGNDTVLSHACRSADLTLFWVLTEGYGADPLEADGRGRMALHHLCEGQDTDHPTPGFFTLVGLVLQRDWRTLLLSDADGNTPLDLAPKVSWPAWNRFLHSNIDRYWPRRSDRKALALEEEAFDRLAMTSCSVPLVDPAEALPVEVARAVANGVLSPEEVVRLKREAEAKALIRKRAVEKAAVVAPAIEGQSGQPAFAHASTAVQAASPSGTSVLPTSTGASDLNSFFLFTGQTA